ncbi:cytochrome d ubiquinol oxidase subunit II [Microbacterium sp. ru370.1]|uniref:cytochrome d ubiquinol oxidase subunit II n=1 Tax=unclassified Microbacterium TaxID=2609290 RepID=UPI00087E2034|nr:MULTISPECIES: cytochrome d ubiquinol oxidase subunit II [unclassified Microbacterium]SDO96318.1 cytochrome d ubiquinol oxidase subunit II [Microbacterium sp. ru370.1]SIT92922.1 cytochrome d ubiquinol oxidase subunit II [Microbacterium sp. RU1D]
MDLAHLWFWIVAFLFVGYFVLDGFDFGVGMSIPFLGKDDIARRQIINTIGPVWDLNETWVIVAGAALFASFPEWYATLFSGFYLPLLVILLALIARGVSFEYRHQRDSLRWKRSFDRMIVAGSALPAFLWGVAFANIVQGVPLDADHEYAGTVLTLLNPYGILGGLTTLLLFFTHGVYFVALKTDGQVRADARRLAGRAGLLTIALAAVFLAWTIAQAAQAPLFLGVVALSGVAALALIGSWVANSRDREGTAFTLGAVTIVTAVAALFFALFPNVMPSTLAGGASLTIDNASSTDYTLTIMSWAALIFLPLILAYQGWTYWVFRKRVTRARIEKAALVAH